MRPTLVLNYLPRGPGFKLARALQYAKDRNKKVPEQVGAMEAVDKALESNIFAKILAARPKLDSHTRINLPKSLLTKLGVTDQGIFGPVSHYQVIKGQRGYLSMFVPLELRHKRMILKKPRYKDTPVSTTYAQDVKKLAASDLQILMREYAPEGHEVLATNGQTGLKIPSIKTHLQVPEIITVGVNQSGLRLAAFVYCQTYLHQNRTPSVR